MGAAVYFLLFVDVLQLLRIMTTPMYGWALDTQQIMNYTDLVWVFTWLSGKVVPRYTFFIVGVILVSIAVADTWYVTHLFQQGGIQKLWPVKLLRFIVATVVTVFFNSLVKWLMVPLARNPTP
ncbi:hypothetical protein T484DRAFT_1769398 [Baffinella frigidus]|nr:hypothetical protein T484DRAFT_1769398 [Cryptophyta sp. CCMP2293]